MQESFRWWQCSDRYIISTFLHLHTLFSPPLISLMVFVDVKHHVYLLACKNIQPCMPGRCQEFVPCFNFYPSGPVTFNSPFTFVMLHCLNVLFLICGIRVMQMAKFSFYALIHFYYEVLLYFVLVGDSVVRWNLNTEMCLSLTVLHLSANFDVDCVLSRTWRSLLTCDLATCVLNWY